MGAPELRPAVVQKLVGVCFAALCQGELRCQHPNRPWRHGSDPRLRRFAAVAQALQQHFDQQAAAGAQCLILSFVMIRKSELKPVAWRHSGPPPGPWTPLCA